MLDKNNLSQLKQLKQKIKASREFANGVVKGTQRRFGFVVLEDGREVYLSPDEMNKVFPGDTVNIEVITTPPKQKNEKAKISGVLKKLLHSPLHEFNGRYVIKNNAHFVAPDLPHLKRWLFIPPQARKEAQEGDYIRCKINRHAYPHGKPQATIVDIIGSADKPGVEADYVMSKFQLNPEWPTDWQSQLQPVNTSSREDLSAIAFVTIDSFGTQDLDDALYVQSTDLGWELQVAIADPTALVIADSTLEELIAARGTSVYLPGHSVSMLPKTMANELCSLLPQEQKPALVCTMQISHEGHIDHYDIKEALVCSQAKLTYNDVSALIANNAAKDNPSLNHADMLNTLNDVTNALNQQRQRDHLVTDGRSTYHLILNEQRKIDAVVPTAKTVAHQLVEECMVAANRCAADMLGESGVFVTHAGFRKERIPDAHKLAEEQLNITDIDATTMAGYQRLLKAIDDSSEFPLRGVLSRLLVRSEISNQKQAHYGMGLDGYTTFTSPIRRYTDFLVHRLLKAKLQQHNYQPPSQDALNTLQEILNNARQARWQTEQWLKCQYMQTLIGQKISGVVSQVNSNGYSVRLDGHNIDGFVDTRQLKKKYSFDPMRLRLKSEDTIIELDKAVEVIVTESNSEERSINFSPANENDEKK